ncbi:hypothetical protein HMPREF2963_02830 [Streptococcus sp. HMSC067A03]|nr:hypothetical protein HMPREF2963_02830 [Streptococcus sp. HMSC067A03]
MDKRKNFIKLLFIGVILFSLGACASTSKMKSEVNYEDLIGAYVYEKKAIQMIHMRITKKNLLYDMFYR